MLSLGVDGHALGEQRTGVLSYLISTLNALAQLPESTQVLSELELFLKQPLSEKELAQLGIQSGSLTVKQAVVPGKRWWTSVHLLKYLAQAKIKGKKLPDVMLYPAHVLPYYSPMKNIVTIHDLAFELFPDYFTKADLRRLTTTTRRSAKAADHLLAVSEATKQDLIRLYKVPAEKITVTPLAVDRSHFKPASQADIERIRTKHKLTKPYIICVSTLQKRKNHARLIEALAVVRAKGLDIDLVFSGGKGWLYEDIFATVEKLGLAQHVKFLGYTDQADLPALYSGAEASALVSLYEGFGMPVLESLACGTVAVIGNNSSLPEVGGKACLAVDAFSVEAIAEALHTVFTDKARRQELQSHIETQITPFTWERTAQQTLAACKHVMKGA